MLDITLDTMAIDAEVPEAEDIAAGAPPLIAVQVVGASALPLADPNNPKRPMRFPSSSIRFPLSKQAALDLGKLLIEKAEALPDAPSSSGKLVTATSLKEAEAVAKAQKSFT